MKAVARFLLALLFSVLVVTFLHFRSLRAPPEVPPTHPRDFYSARDLFVRRPAKHVPRPPRCTMSTCFNLSRCAQTATSGLRVHVYGDASGSSETFLKVLKAIEESVFFESDPKKACVFVAATWDPMDRDPLSRDFQRPTRAMATEEPLFSGENHVVFNLYAGTWPQYREMDLNFDKSFGKILQILPKAILAKASQSVDHFRPHFDVSLPLFARSHAFRGLQEVDPPPAPPQPVIGPRVGGVAGASLSRKWLLVFKGKRYLYGIGSETRNALHFLENARDVHVLTTCRHGKKWRELKDAHCDQDDSLYHNQDYSALMANATFCLVPRGRRLASYRFLEAIQLGCIPVLLSNGHVLPFHELIDWSACAVKADERLVLQVPEMLRQMSRTRVDRMRSSCGALYRRFFSSVEKIVFLTFLQIENRIAPQMALTRFVNQLHAPPKHELHVAGLQLGLAPPKHVARAATGLTCVLHVTDASHVRELERVLLQMARNPLVRHVRLLWHLNSSAPTRGLTRFAKTRVEMFGSRFALDAIETDAVLQMAPHATLSDLEIAFAYDVWRHLEARVVGFEARDHFFDGQRFQLSSKWSNHVSSVTLAAAIHHRALGQLFAEYRRARHLPADDACAELGFAFFAAHVTGQAPVKVTGRKRVTRTGQTLLEWERTRACFAALVNNYTYCPLRRSPLRLDPTLFGDRVARRRKKYASLEL